MLNLGDDLQQQGQYSWIKSNVCHRVIRYQINEFGFDFTKKQNVFILAEFFVKQNKRDHIHFTASLHNRSCTAVI